MATDNPGPDLSFAASGDLSASQFCAVHLDANSQLVLSDSEADAAFGILQDKPAAAGRAGRVRTAGVTKAWVSGTVASMDRLAPTGSGTVSGYLIVTTTDTHNYVAIALEPHTADDATALIEVLVSPGSLSA